MSDVKPEAVILPAHYTQYKIEPIYFIRENNLPFWMGNVIKYVTRAEMKDGIQDLHKARRYLDMEIARQEGRTDYAATSRPAVEVTHEGEPYHGMMEAFLRGSCLCAMCELKRKEFADHG